MRPFLLLASTFLCLMTGRLCADPLDYWTLAHSRTNHIPTAGVFGKGRFVVTVVGVDGGRSGVWTSEEGKEWRVTFDDGMGSLLFANDLFVGTASGGRVVSSEDGQTWVTRRLPIAGEAGPIVAAFGKFWTVARVGESHSLFASEDALAWEAVVGGLSTDRVLYGDRHALILQSSGFPFVQSISFNGIDFTNASPMPLFSSLARIGDTWVGVEATNPERNIAVSTNRNDWISFLPKPYVSEGGRVATIGGRFVMLPTVPRTLFLESLDGLNWVDHEVALLTRIHGLVSGRDSVLALASQQLATPKPGTFSYVTRFYFSRPFTPTLPQPLEASLRPAVVLRSGIVGAGYAIESATKPEGPWIHATTVFPTGFPFSVLVPDGHGERGFFRSVLRDR